MEDKAIQKSSKPTLRDSSGKFLPGSGCGRPPGTPNLSTLDSRALRSRILRSWTDVDADGKLRDLAETDFPTYLKCVISLLPRDVNIDVEAFVRPSVDTPQAAAFVSFVRSRCLGRPATMADVVAALMTFQSQPQLERAEQEVIINPE